mmetsp:Transcript_8922/g.33106  ORF Transcript_8922/g.33106 Transcript_8922/m.33106 type:complete len:231 (+) Transcript_8922:826-1518(+)
MARLNDASTSTLTVFAFLFSSSAACRASAKNALTSPTLCLNASLTSLVISSRNCFVSLAARSAASAALATLFANSRASTASTARDTLTPPSLPSSLAPAFALARASSALARANAALARSVASRAFGHAQYANPTIAAARVTVPVNVRTGATTVGVTCEPANAPPPTALAPPHRRNASSISSSRNPFDVKNARFASTSELAATLACVRKLTAFEISPSRIASRALIASACA